MLCVIILLKEAKTGPFKVFGDTLRKYPDLLFTQALGAISNVVLKNCVYPGVYRYNNYDKGIRYLFTDSINFYAYISQET